MKSLYLILDALTVFFPFVLSFDKKVHYFKHWKNALIAAFLIAVPFLIWDILFTQHGIWGFNERYLIGINIINLPIEEVLFFFVVPFACTFIYEVCKKYFTNVDQKFANLLIQLGIALYTLTLIIKDPSGWYTIIVSCSAMIVLYLWVSSKKRSFIGLAFTLSLLPFFLMNGVLTGYATPEPIVWYNEEQKVAARILTIPLEDILYSFTLIVSNIMTFELLNKKQK